MNHAPLFTGINGFGLAADWMGWNQPFHVEIDEFCQRIIQYYWPKSSVYHDIKKTDFTKYRGTIDVISGGFPCQPFSVAGNKRGTTDDRYLWPEMLRAIREIQPVAIVGENVTGILSMEKYEVFAKVESRNVIRYMDIDKYEAVYTRQAKMLVNSICEDLEKEGYKVQTFIIPAAGVNAPHRRDRIWFIAYSEHNGSYGSKDRQSHTQGNDHNEAWKKATQQLAGCNKQTVITNANNSGCKNRQLDRQTLPESDKRRKNTTEYNTEVTFNDITNPKYEGLQRNKWEESYDKRVGKETFGSASERIKIPTWDKWPTQSPVCIGNDGVSSRLHGITFSKLRRESIKSAGNAIVPQIAYEIFKAIEKII